MIDSGTHCADPMSEKKIESSSHCADSEKMLESTSHFGRVDSLLKPSAVCSRRKLIKFFAAVLGLSLLLACLVWFQVGPSRRRLPGTLRKAAKAAKMFLVGEKVHQEIRSGKTVHKSLYKAMHAYYHDEHICLNSSKEDFVYDKVLKILPNDLKERLNLPPYSKTHTTGSAPETHQMQRIRIPDPLNKRLMVNIVVFFGETLVDEGIDGYYVESRTGWMSDGNDLKRGFYKDNDTKKGAFLYRADGEEWKLTGWSPNQYGRKDKTLVCPALGFGVDLCYTPEENEADEEAPPIDARRRPIPEGRDNGTLSEEARLKCCDEMVFTAEMMASAAPASATTALRLKGELKKGDIAVYTGSNEIFKNKKCRLIEYKRYKTGLRWKVHFLYLLVDDQRVKKEDLEFVRDYRRRLVATDYSPVTPDFGATAALNQSPVMELEVESPNGANHVLTGVILILFLVGCAILFMVVRSFRAKSEVSETEPEQLV